MKQTQMQLKGKMRLNGMTANFWHANSAHELKYCERTNKTYGGELSLSNATAVHAATPTGHEGHGFFFLLAAASFWLSWTR